MTYQVADSPWQVASNPEAYSNTTQEYWGECSINAWWCALVSGMGKVPYDPKTLDPKTGKAPRRYTAIDLAVNPLAECNLEWDVKRSMLAEFGEWKDIVWPSIRNMGIMEASELDGKFVHVELVENGTYQKDGETKKKTTFNFIQVFDDRAGCLAAYRMKNGEAAPVETPATPPPSNGKGKEIEVALKFARPVIAGAVRKAGGDIQKAHDLVAEAIAGQSMINRHFTVDSPEIMAMLMEELNQVAPF